MTRAQTIIDRFEMFAPKSLAVPGDPIGWQLGDPNQDVKKILVTLDVRPEVVAEAKQLGAEMIFAHHPAMFRPAKNMVLTDPQTQMYADILRANIAVYAAHTNLDSVAGGMNDWLAQALHLTQIVPFIDEGEEAGMGRIGQLEHPMPLADLIRTVKNTYHLKGLRVVANDLQREIKRVAILGGDGGKFYLDAEAAGADVYITGDVYYHTGHDMLAADMPVIDPGHHIEQIMKQHVTDLLNQWAVENDWSVEAAPSQLSTDPYQFF
ncbi:Nif3-like dinuclear metal center hexameric protein [Lacticaseibacillus saniviri]